MRVIVAEDFRTLHSVYRAEIKSTNRNTEIDFTEDGGELVNKVREAGPGWYDLILTDNLMKEMDGLDAIRAIRLFDNDTPICIITSQKIYDEAMVAGATDYIRKDLKGNNFNESLKSFLEKYLR